MISTSTGETYEDEFNHAMDNSHDKAEGVEVAMEPFDPSTGQRMFERNKIGEGGGGGLETIKSPAVRHTESGRIFEDMNHGLAAAQAEESVGAGLNYNQLEHGFTTSSGRFVDRPTASFIAEQAEKSGIKQFGEGRGPRNRGLISEDLQKTQDWMAEKYSGVKQKLLETKQYSSGQKVSPEMQERLKFREEQQKLIPNLEETAGFTRDAEGNLTRSITTNKPTPKGAADYYTPKERPFPQRENYNQLTPDLLDKIKTGLEKGQSMGQVADSLGMTRGRVAGIMNRNALRTFNPPGRPRKPE